MPEPAPCEEVPAEVPPGEEEGEGARRPERRGRKRVLWMVILVVLLVVVPSLLYFTVVPRTELSVRVFYNESMLNRINIDAELRNLGTVKATGIILDLAVLNSTDTAMAQKEYQVSEVEPLGRTVGLESFFFRGSQLEGYTVVIVLEFSSNGKRHVEHWSHDTEEPWLNQEWTDTVSGM